jgi:hypothetical protein
MAYIDVRDSATNKLLFRYDAARAIIEIKHGSVKTLVDLTQYSSQENASHCCEQSRRGQPVEEVDNEHRTTQTVLSVQARKAHQRVLQE